jgi:signal transduction histidine kinase
MNETVSKTDSPDPGNDAARFGAAAAEAASSGTGHEHAFQSLLQLGIELAGSLSLYETVDLLLFNLMGQFRTTRAAVWLLGEDPPTPVLVRCRGFREKAAEAAEATCGEALKERFAERQEPILTWALSEQMGPSGLQLLERLGVALFAPVTARGELLGWLALGPRLGGESYSTADLEILQASLGIAGASIQNANLYNQVLEANRHLRVTNDRLHELDRLKSEFLSNVNHELRTPLTVVIGALECIEFKNDNLASAQEFIQIALVNSRQLKHLLENLLMFSAVLHDRLPFQLVEGDVGCAFKACFEARLPGVNGGLRELSFLCAPELPRARFDAQRFGQIVDELIDNAIKFTPRGCRIRLQANRHEEDGRTWVRVDVADDGPGIPETKMESLFDAFAQIDGSSTRRAGGLGMGLAFSKQLAERMDCRLTVASEPGHGSTFTLLIPAA